MMEMKGDASCAMGFKERATGCRSGIESGFPKPEWFQYIMLSSSHWVIGGGARELTWDMVICGCVGPAGTSS
jgi:hypothetical protein